MIIYMYLSRERERKPRTTTNNSNVVDFLHWKNNKKRETLEEEKNREKVRDEFEQGWETEPVGFVSLWETNWKKHEITLQAMCVCAQTKTWRTGKRDVGNTGKRVVYMTGKGRFLVSCNWLKFTALEVFYDIFLKGEIEQLSSKNHQKEFDRNLAKKRKTNQC